MRFFILFLLALTFAPQQAFTNNVLLTTDHNNLTIKSGAETHAFTVELADTPEKARRGLMFRAYLAPHHGMLFLMDGRRAATMWMKNTPLSLDIIFIDKNGHIINIAENTLPYTLDTIAAEAPTSAVLEVEAGTAKRLKLKANDKVIHPLINPANRKP